MINYVHLRLNDIKNSLAASVMSSDNNNNEAMEIYNSIFGFDKYKKNKRKLPYITELVQLIN